MAFEIQLLNQLEAGRMHWEEKRKEKTKKSKTYF